MSDAQTTEQVRGLLKAALEERRIDYRELASLLGRLGTTFSEAEVTDTIDRGEISGAFFVLCCEAIGAPLIHLDF
ncbi:DUF6471 domain-containing protein [Phenylobacterium sp.]|uniref:DUF6471 domain-containing protein n=1 Tax=Phenylobacterium sp. TaxID=1871053 RepID=UPI0030F3AB93